MATAAMGALAGAFLVWLLSSRELTIIPVGVSYGDLAAIALTAATVILAVFGLILAGAAWFGYHEFIKKSAAVAEAKAHEVAEPAAISEVQTYLDKNLDQDIRARARTIATQLLTPDYLQSLIIEQINTIQTGNQRDERLDVQVSEEGMVDNDPQQPAENDSEAGTGIAAGTTDVVDGMHQNLAPIILEEDDLEDLDRAEAEVEAEVEAHIEPTFQFEDDTAAKTEGQIDSHPNDEIEQPSTVNEDTVEKSDAKGEMK